MRYSDDIIEEVRERNNIVDVIGSYVHLTKKSGRYWGLCPFHGEKTPSFSVNEQRQMYYCFGCHKGGNVITFLMEYENLTFQEAVRELAERVGMQLPDTEPTEEEKRKAGFRAKLMEVNKLSAEFFFKLRMTDEGKIADDYLKKRGLSDETIVRFGLGYAGRSGNKLYNFLKDKGYDDEFLKKTGLVTLNERGGSDKFWNRVMFPIMDERNRVIAFGGRVMGDGEPKYLNSPETEVFDKSNNLYGLNYARLGKKDYFLLCEGYMDVIALQQAGFQNSVASLGTALTEKHAIKIAKYVKKVYLTYDSDGAGIKAALRAIPILNGQGITAKVVNMKPYKDPDEFIRNLGREEYERRIENAESSFFFEVSVMASKYDMRNPAEKTEFQREVAVRLLDFKESLERENYENAFTERYAVDSGGFHEMLTDVAGKKNVREKDYAPKDQKERAPYVSRKERERDEKLLKPQRLLLTYLSIYPKLYGKISNVLTPEEFTDDIYRRVAEAAYSDCMTTGEVNGSKIINMFEEKEEQEIVGAIFQTELEGELNEAENLKAVEDLVRKIKLSSIEERMKKALTDNDTETYKSLFDVQTKLKNRSYKLI